MIDLILTAIFLLISLGLSGVLFYFAHLYEHWYFFFVPILTIPGFYLGLFVVYILILYLVSLCLNTKKEVDKPNRFFNFIVNQTCTQLLLLSRTRVKVEGRELFDSKKKHLFVSNHISSFDPIVMMRKLKVKNLMAVSKKENLKFPICGPFIHHAGFIFLDREDPHSAVRMLQKATHYLNQDWASIYICPEGTRSKTTELLPFHSGSFKIATKAEVDIVVCYLENTNLIAKHFPLKGTKVKLKVLKVISKEEVLSMNTHELASIAYETIQKEKERK